MPNWTFCVLDAPADVLKKYISVDSNGEKRFDFNLVIPRPEVYDDPDLVAGGLQWEAIAFYKGRLSDEDRQRIMKYKDVSFENLYKIGRKYVEAYEKYGYYNWYDWSSDNWGTKWNGCDCYIDEDNGYAEFNTAWCYPEPVINKIFEDNPGCRIRFEWHDEDYDGNHEILRDEDGEFHYSTEWIEENDPCY